ncbi:MAG: hypothetical protein J6K15_14250 [Lachnospiraceae bacterium]|nr:hypothetical protein [Lachnospiraceae bacterium]
MQEKNTYNLIDEEEYAKYLEALGEYLESHPDMNINRIRKNDVASTTYLISTLYPIITETLKDSYSSLYIRGDGTLFFFDFRNSVSNEEIEIFESEPLEFYEHKLPSGIYSYGIKGAIDKMGVINGDFFTADALNAILNAGNEEMYMALIDIKADKIVALRNVELPRHVIKSLHRCGKSTINAGYTSPYSLAESVVSEFISLGSKVKPIPYTYVGRELRSSLPDIQLFI